MIMKPSIPIIEELGQPAKTEILIIDVSITDPMIMLDTVINIANLFSEAVSWLKITFNYPS